MKTIFVVASASVALTSAAGLLDRMQRRGLLQQSASGSCWKRKWQWPDDSCVQKDSCAQWELDLAWTESWEKCCEGHCKGEGLVNPNAGCTEGSCTASGQCKVAGQCDLVSGQCGQETNAADGTSCDDGNPSTTSDVCSQGACAGSDLCLGVACSASGPCKVPGSCDPLTGQCGAETNAADGTACDDGDAATTVDVCMAGVCTGTTAPTCFDNVQNGDEAGVDCGGSCDQQCDTDECPEWSSADLSSASCVTYRSRDGDASKDLRCTPMRVGDGVARTTTNEPCVIYDGELYSVHWWTRSSSAADPSPEDCRWYKGGCFNADQTAACSAVNGCAFERLTHQEVPREEYVGTPNLPAGVAEGSSSCHRSYTLDDHPTNFCRGWDTSFPALNTVTNGDAQGALYTVALSKHIFDAVQNNMVKSVFDNSRLYKHHDPIAGQVDTDEHLACGTCWRVYASGFANDADTLAMHDQYRDVVVIDKMPHDDKEIYVNGDASMIPNDFTTTSQYRAFDLQSEMFADGSNAWVRTHTDVAKGCDGVVGTRFQMIDCSTRVPLSGISDGFGDMFPAAN